MTMNTSASNRRLRVLLTAIGSGALIPQPDFQRRLVWTNKDKVEFIRTVISGYPFPEIYIAAGRVDPKTGEGAEVLVDGQQRVTTLYQYFKGDPDLRLPADIENYENLPENKQIEFLEYSVVVRDLGAMSIEVIKDIFKKINSTSYGLNAMEIDNARYDGEFKKFSEKLSEHKFFYDYRIFTSSDIKRMNDVRYCLGLVTTIMSTYFNRDKEIEVYLEKYNEEFDAKDLLNTNVTMVLSFIDSMNFTASSRAMKKADFYTLFVEVHRLMIYEGVDLDNSKCRNSLDAFYEKVEEVSSNTYKGTEDEPQVYYKAALQASNDRSNRISRGRIIHSVLIGD
ncbi:GmrSD restriction endonuclease domain-containing protein [Rahnella sp. EDr1-12]|uniref:GmrSD restriction endonuclease domain-containing protein n=1 Tax=unclassified Rahnella TaxID=2635087 RepID=UPI003BAC4517